MRRRRLASASSETLILNGRIAALPWAAAGICSTIKPNAPATAEVARTSRRVGDVADMTFSCVCYLLNSTGNSGERKGAPVASRGTAQRFERRTHLGDEELRLLPGREVGALRELVVVNEFWVRFLCPAPRGRIDLVGEGAHSDRDLDAPYVEEAPCRQVVRGVPVEARGRDRGVGQPVERDVIEYVVRREAFGPASESAGDHQ